MVKKLGFFIPLVLTLTACGGGSDDSNGSTNGPNTGNNKIQCNKGIPSGMPPLGRGIFDQDLYSIDTQYDSNLPPSQAKPHLVGEKLSLNKHTLYTSTVAISHPESEVETQSHNFDYLLNDKGLFTTKEYTQANDGSWPIGYIHSMSENQITFNHFNDVCDLEVYSSDLELEKIDLSGQPISLLFEQDQNVSHIGYKHIENGFGYFIDPSWPISAEEKQRKQNFEIMLKDKTLFPTGSYVYLMKPIKQNSTVYYFDEEPTDYSTLQEWAKNTYKNHKNWKEIKVGGYQVLQALNDDQTYNCSIDPAILKDGKVYDGECELAGKITDKFNIDFYMNKSTYDAVRTQLKTYYGFK